MMKKTQPGLVSTKRRPNERGLLEADMMVALAIFAIVILPLGYSFSREQKVFFIEYSRSAANEIVDGEMEILAAGEGRNQAEGTHVYKVRAHAAAALPPCHFDLTKTGNHLRLEWQADAKTGIGTVARELNLQ